VLAAPLWAPPWVAYVKWGQHGARSKGVRNSRGQSRQYNTNNARISQSSPSTSVAVIPLDWGHADLQAAWRFRARAGVRDIVRAVVRVENRD